MALFPDSLMFCKGRFSMNPVKCVEASILASRLNNPIHVASKGNATPT